MNFKITATQTTAVIAYLQKRPYEEVVQVIAMLVQLPKIEPEKKEIDVQETV